MARPAPRDSLTLLRLLRQCARFSRLWRRAVTPISTVPDPCAGGTRLARRGSSSCLSISVDHMATRWNKTQPAHLRVGDIAGSDKFSMSFNILRSPCKIRRSLDSPPSPGSAHVPAHKPNSFTTPTVRAGTKVIIRTPISEIRKNGTQEYHMSKRSRLNRNEARNRFIPTGGVR